MTPRWRALVEKGSASSTSTTTTRTTKTVTAPVSTTEVSSTTPSNPPSTADVQTSTTSSTSTSSPTSQQSGDKPSPEPTNSPASIARPADSPSTTTSDSDAPWTHPPDHTRAPSSSTPTHTASSHSQIHFHKSNIVAAAVGSIAFLAFLGALFYIMRRRARQSRVAAEDRWDPARGIDEYGRPTLPNVGQVDGGAGVYEKGVNGAGNGLERYTRPGAKGSFLGDARPDMGAVQSPIERPMSELHSPTVSELASPMGGRGVTELHSPVMGSPVAELQSPTFEARVAELGGHTEKGGVAEMGGREIGRGVELDAGLEQQGQQRFYGGAR